MNETNQAVDTAPEEAAAPAEEAAEQESAPKAEMPPEERSRHAARRREAERQAKEQENAEREGALRRQIMSHPLMQQAVGLIEETRFKRDLDQVRTVYPNLTAKSPMEVGELYCRLMASGQVDPVVAYEAQVAADRRADPVPENMVSARSAGGAALYYSSKELDALTEQDLKDPGIFQKALASLSKLRR